MLDFGLVVLFVFVAGFALLAVLGLAGALFALLLTDADLAGTLLLALVTGFTLLVVVDLATALLALLLTDADGEEEAFEVEERDLAWDLGASFFGVGFAELFGFVLDALAFAVEAFFTATAFGFDSLDTTLG